MTDDSVTIDRETAREIAAEIRAFGGNHNTGVDWRDRLAAWADLLDPPPKSLREIALDAVRARAIGIGGSEIVTYGISVGVVLDTIRAEFADVWVSNGSGFRVDTGRLAEFDRRLRGES